MADLEFKISWFGTQAERLEEAAASLDALRNCIDLISYAPEYEIAMLRPEYWDWRAEALREDASLSAGDLAYRQMAQAIRTTGRNYARAEAANTEEASQVERWLEEAGL